VRQTDQRAARQTDKPEGYHQPPDRRTDVYQARQIRGLPDRQIKNRPQPHRQNIRLSQNPLGSCVKRRPCGKLQSHAHRHSQGPRRRDDEGADTKNSC
jgi:hypothetical protein